MALEAIVFQQDPFVYNCKDYSYNTESYDGDFVPLFVPENLDITECSNYYTCWDSPPSPALISQHSSAGLSPEDLTGAVPAAGNVFHATGAAPSRRKRRRAKTVKNKEEMENQRMTHIAVERNRRRQMNDYLAILRSLMPPSYSQRGDQASIVGGAINFVKELEQLLQSLEGRPKNTYDPRQPNTACHNLNPLASFFTFPQYTTSPSSQQDESCNNITMDPISMERRSDLADIEVAVVDTHANIKILTKARPKQLLKMVSGFQSLGLTILHLNVTTVDQYVLYTFSVKVEEECQLTTVNEIAAGVHDIVGMIQQETTLSMSI